MALLIAFVTFIVATVICLLIWLSFGTDSRQEVIQRRMDAVHRAERRGPVYFGVQLVRDETLSGVPALKSVPNVVTSWPMAVGSAILMWVVSLLTPPPSPATIERYFPRG